MWKFCFKICVFPATFFFIGKYLMVQYLEADPTCMIRTPTIKSLLTTTMATEDQGHQLKCITTTMTLLSAFAASATASQPPQTNRSAEDPDSLEFFLPFFKTKRASLNKSTIQMFHVKQD